MEYAASGELFQRICSADRFSEDQARFFFQQLISGVSYYHSNPSKKVTIPEIKRHPWFRKHLPRDLIRGEKTKYVTARPTSVKEVMRILQSDHSAEAGEHILAGLCDIKEEEEKDDDDFLDFEVDTNGQYISITRN